jgi:hypothetical protein
MAALILAVYGSRVLQHRFYRDPAVTLQTLEKTAPTPGMAGNPATLLHPQHHYIIVTIQADLADQLFMP